MKTKLILLTLLLCILSGCTVVGNSPMERKHRLGLPSTQPNTDIGPAYFNFASNP